VGRTSLCQRRFLNILLPVLGEPPGAGATAAGRSPQQLAGNALPDAGLPGGNAPGITLLNIGTGLLKAPGGAGGPRSTGVTTCVSGQAGAGCGQSAPSSSMSVITGGGGGAGTTGAGLLPLGFPGGNSCKGNSAWRPREVAVAPERRTPIRMDARAHFQLGGVPGERPHPCWPDFDDHLFLR
jgi:hypothetical protein